MIEKNINLPEVDDGLIIWRYMDFATFYSLLINKALFFRRLDKQTDKLDGTLNETIIEEFFNKWKLFGFSDLESREKAIKEYDYIINYKKFTLTNSWTISDNEDYALWKIYLRGSREGVAIKTSVKKLKESLSANQWHIHLSKVNYDYSQLKIESLNQHNVSTYKRKTYKYENELRVYVLNHLKMGLNEEGQSSKIPLCEIGENIETDLDLLIDEVYLSPFSGGWFKNIVENVISEFLKAKKITLYQSEIIDS